MAFPDSDLLVSVFACFGANLTAQPGSWIRTDLSGRVVTTEPITVGRGVVVGTGTRRGSTGTITLLNDDGWLTPENPISPWWPYVDQGTPISISIGTGIITTYISDTFTRTLAGTWGTPEVGPPTGTSWLASTSGLSVTGGKGTISHTGSANEILFTRIFWFHKDIELVYDAAISAVATGAPMGVGPGMRANSNTSDRMWPVLEFQPGGTIRWALWQRIASTYTNQGVAVQPGLTYSAGTAIRCRVRYTGGRIQARAWLAAGTEPADWALDVTTTTFLDGGKYIEFLSWREAGNTNTNPITTTIDNFALTSAAMVARCEGYIADVKPSYRPLGDGTTHSVVTVTVGGIGSRQERRTADPWSPMRRSVQDATTAPIAYWPLEDKAQSTSAASAIPGQASLTAVGPVVFTFDLGEIDDDYISRYGSLGLTSVAAGAKLTGPVPVSATGQWTVSTFLQAKAASVPITEMRLLEWATTGGTHSRWALVSTSTGHAVRAYNDTAGTVTDVVSYIDGLNVPLMHSVTAKQNGGNIDVQLVFVGNVSATGSIAGTLGAVNRMTVNPDQVNTTASTSPFGIRFLLGHLMVHDVATTGTLPLYFDTTTGQVPRADEGWKKEALHRRLARLSLEERVPFRSVGDPYSSGVTLLGPQPAGGFVDLMTSTAESGSGDLLVEAEYGYVHTARSERYNGSPDLVVDMTVYARSGGTDPTDVLVPVLGKPGANYWTVERRNGSSATYAADEAYRDRRGTMQDKATLDVLSDYDTGPHAQWRTHLAVDGKGATYPQFEIDLAANPGLVDGWLRCDIGSRIQWTNQPTVAGIGTIDQVIDGITETFTHSQSSAGRGWVAKLDTSPASVWDTGVWDSATSLWQPSNTVLSSGVNTTATSWSMNSNGEPWITGAVSIRAQLGREQITITNISGSGSAWTFTVTRSVNTVVTAHTAGAEQLTLLDAGTWGL